MASDDLQATLSAAIQSARYNEAVVVSVNDDSSSREIVLVACLDEENGGIIWRNESGGMGGDDRDDDATAAAAMSKSAYYATEVDTSANGRLRDDPGIIRHLRTKKWVLPMLNDERRNQLYQHAIRQACSEMCQRRAMESHNKDIVDSIDKTKIRILDIGSGTGLLAMMGAKYADDAQQLIAEPEQKQSVQVTSVEMASAMARLARITVEENGMSDKIQIVENHSTDSAFQMDDARFGENGRDSVPLSQNDKDITKAKRVKFGVKEGINEKADICTSELIESGLLGEGVLPTIRDSWERHLKSDAIVIPRRARVYAVLIEGSPIASTSADDTAADDYLENTTVNAATAFLGPDLHAFYKASGGVWLATTASSSSDSKKRSSALLDPTHDGVRIPLHANVMPHKNGTYDLIHDILPGTRFGEQRGLRPLTAPVEVLDFVFSEGKDALPPPSGRRTIKDVTPITDGNCHGVLFWWELDLWDDDDSTYSTIPFECFDSNGKNNIRHISHWQDHWQQCLFVFGDSQLSEHAGETRKLRMGHPVQIISYHDDYAISFSISDVPTMPASTSQDFSDIESRPLKKGNNTIFSNSNHLISTTRALQLNDISRITTLRAAIQYCIDAIGHDAPLLDVSDMGICAMIASVLGSRNVTSLESSSGTLPTAAATVAQIGNGLPRPSSGYQIIRAQTEHLLADHILGGAANIVVAEPYYEVLEGWHLQEALNYFYTVRSFKKRGVVSLTALSVPAFANVMACVVEFEQFNSAYGQGGDSTSCKVGGFKHSAVNHYGNRYHTFDVSLPMWQYRYKPLSKPFCMAIIPYEGSNLTIDTKDDVSQLFISPGCAQAVVFWVDYHCRMNHEENFDVISTSSSSHRQLVRKLPRSIEVSEEDINAGLKFCCRISFGDDNSDGIEDHSFSFDIKPSST